MAPQSHCWLAATSRCGPAILSPEVLVFLRGGQDLCGEGLPSPGGCWCCSGFPMSFGGSCKSEEVGALPTKDCCLGPLSETNSHHFLGVSCPEGGRKQGSSSFVLPQLILPLPCPDFWTFLFLVQPLTLNVEFIPRQTSQCDSNNNSGTCSMLCQEPKGAFLSQWADLEKSGPHMEEVRVGNVPTTDISSQRSSTVMLWIIPTSLLRRSDCYHPV